MSTTSSSRLSQLSETVQWLWTQLFSSHPDVSVTSGTRMLLWMARGLLIVGALSSVSYTAPTFYNIWGGIIVEWLAQALTVACVVLVLFLIELSFGALTPFIWDYTISGDITKSKESAIGGLALWLLVIFLGSCSVYFTWSGASVPIEAAMIAPENPDIQSLELKKQAAILAEEKRHEAIVNKYIADDEAALASLKKYHANNIQSINDYAVRQYGKYSKVVTEATDKARKDSIRQVEDFVMVKAKAPSAIRERSLAINDARKTWNDLIFVEKEKFSKKEVSHAAKVSAAMNLIRGFGSGSTVMFFLIVAVVSLLSNGKKKARP